jgi:hypothetical protein
VWCPHLAYGVPLSTVVIERDQLARRLTPPVSGGPHPTDSCVWTKPVVWAVRSSGWLGGPVQGTVAHLVSSSPASRSQGLGQLGNRLFVLPQQTQKCHELTRTRATIPGTRCLPDVAAAWDASGVSLHGTDSTGPCGTLPPSAPSEIDRSGTRTRRQSGLSRARTHVDAIRALFEGALQWLAS